MAFVGVGSGVAFKGGLGMSARPVVIGLGTHASDLADL